jgi:hypothetical protein
MGILHELVYVIVRAQEWMRSIVAGEFKDQRAIAAETDLSEPYVKRH